VSINPAAPQRILGVFEDVIEEMAEALAKLDDWGHSGGRPDQYTHDVVADRIVRRRLHDAGYAVLSEESGVTGDGEIVVVVDPIDGSTNASRGLPWYATSLCAVDDQGPLVADVVNLATGDRYRAVRGEGVEAEGAAIAPSQCMRLDEAIVALNGLPPFHGGWAQYRTYGAIALDLCAVATGSFDGYVDVDGAHGVWDYLAAALVCYESEVSVVDAHGRDLLMFDVNARRAPVAAATPELLDQLLAMYHSWGGEPQGA